MIVNAGGKGKGTKSNNSAPKNTRKYCQIIRANLIFDEKLYKKVLLTSLNATSCNSRDEIFRRFIL